MRTCVLLLLLSGSIAAGQAPPASVPTTTATEELTPLAPVPPAPSQLGWSTTAPATQPAGPPIEVRIDPRVELLSIVFRLAGAAEFNHAGARSAYSDEVDRQFAAVRDHPAVQTAARLRNELGIRYEAVMSLAFHVDNVVHLGERVPLEQASRLDARWELQRTRAFLEDLRGFSRASEFAQFYRSNQTRYRAAAARLATPLNQFPLRGWLDPYFGGPPAGPFFVTIGMLAGSEVYEPSVRLSPTQLEVCPVVGSLRFDPEGVPVFDEQVLGAVVRTYCRATTDALVDAQAEGLQSAGTRIFKHCVEAMHRQGYAGWKEMFYQSLPRAVGVRMLAVHATQDALDAELYAESDAWFQWVEPLAKLLEREYEPHRDQYPRFAAFMPRIVAFFDEYAGQYEGEMARTPKILSMTPANGATGVDPTLTELKVLFDRPMVPHVYAVLGWGPDYIEMTDAPDYDPAGRELTIPVRLKPNWTYRFWLNRGEYLTIRSEQGIPLRPTPVTFSTRGFDE